MKLLLLLLFPMPAFATLYYMEGDCFDGCEGIVRLEVVSTESGPIEGLDKIVSIKIYNQDRAYDLIFETYEEDFAPYVKFDPDNSTLWTCCDVSGDVDLSVGEYSWFGDPVSDDKRYIDMGGVQGLRGKATAGTFQVPEPGGLSMAAIGFAFLILLRRFRGEHPEM